MAITNAFPDYARLVDIVRQLELEYAHNPDKAAEIINEEMVALGAEMVDGVWHYEDEPVEVIFLIRTEDERKEIGDYVATMLEDLGFEPSTVTIRPPRRPRQSGSAPTPTKGSSTSTPAGGSQPRSAAIRLATSTSSIQTAGCPSHCGRHTRLRKSSTPHPKNWICAISRPWKSGVTSSPTFLALSMQDSVRVWLVNQLGFTAYRNDVSVSTDLAGGLNGARLWPYTLRRTGEEGGTLTIAMPSMLPEPWNPVAGTNWIYDTMLIRSTQDVGTMPDPFTGLQWPQRIERAEVTVKEGLPVGSTHDWVDLTFAEQIDVPEDALLDWDAVEQQFITVGDLHPDGLTANIKSVVYYPGDLYDLTWHDGSQIALADIVLDMILTFDLAKEESAVFDEAQLPSLNNFQSHFRGYRIVQENPLIIEYYSDQYTLDAELNVVTFFPSTSWHSMAVGLLAEAAGDLAFSSDKADANEVEWMSYIAGPSIEILAGHLEEAAAGGHIPYASTLGDYISADDAAARWENLSAWYEDKGHFWVGLGPFYLEKAFTTEKTVQLVRNENFLDPSSKWEGFDTPMIAEVSIDGPARVAAGDEATFDVLIDFGGDAYAIADIDEVKYLVFDALGELALTGTAEAVEDGLWQITLSAEDTAGLESGANKLEVAVAPLRVSIPTFSSVEFVTTN